MSAEGHGGVNEHINGVQDILQPITNVEPTVGGLDVKDASEHRAFDQKLAGHAMDHNIDGTSGAKPDEYGERESLDAIFVDKTNEEQLQRPFDPIAKTLEANNENMVEPATVHERADIVGSSDSLVPVVRGGMDLNVSHVTEEPLHTNPAPESEPGQGAQEFSAHEDIDINAAEVIPAAIDSEAIPSPSEVPVDVLPQAHQPVAEPETSIASTDALAEAQPVSAKADDHAPEPAAVTPEVENPVSVVKPLAAEAESVGIQLPETPPREEEPQAAEAETAEVHTSETHYEPEEAQVGMQLAAAVMGPEIQVDNKEASPAAVIEQPVLPVVQDDVEPEAPQPQTSAIPAETQMVEQSPADETEATPLVEVTPEEALFVETESAFVESEVPPHGTDSVVRSVASPADVEQEDPSPELLSVGNGEDVERPRSPWTPSYSVTTQGPGESYVVENVVEPEEQEDISLPTKESTPEIVVRHADTTEPAEASIDVAVSQVDAEVAQGDDTEPPTHESIEEDLVFKSRSPLAVDMLTLSLDGDEAKEERPKSPWTPSYSVTTQGSAPHEHAELDQLDQLPPSVIEDVEHHTHGAIDEVSIAEHFETVAVEAHVDADQNDEENARVPPADVPATEVSIAEALAGALAAHPDTVVPQEDAKSILVGSRPSEDDIAPQSPSQLTVDIPSPKLGDEESRPKSPWTPSYSVTSQGSARGPAEVGDIEQIPNSDIEPIGQPDVGQVEFTGTSVLAPSVPEAVVQGGQNGHEHLRDQPAAIPSTDIVESQELPNIPSVHEATAEYADDNAAPTPSQSSTGEVALKSPSQLLANISLNITEDEDRPKSPWTPSYSVTTQGSASQDSGDLDELEQPPPSTVEAIEDPMTSPADGTMMAAHSILSVYEVEPDNQTSKPTFDEVTAPPPSQLKAVLLDETQLAKGAESEEATLGLEVQTNVSLVIPESNIVEDRPASPWTPSYSVTTLGLALSDGQESVLHQEDLDQLEQLPEHSSGREAVLPIVTEDIDDMSVSSNVPEPPHTPQSELGIFTPGFDTRSEVSAASGEPASPTSSRTDLMSLGVDHVEESAIPATTNTLVLPVLAIEQDDSTPQLTPLAIVKDVPDTIAGEEVAQQSTLEQQIKSGYEIAGGHNVPQTFPGSPNILAGDPTPTIRKKPSLLHLAPLDEDGGSDRPLISFEMPSSATSRKRLESTTSSRFLPGWLSSSPTVPEVSRTRTSLDVASGEFIRSPSTESRPSGESLASEAASVPSAGEDEEKKARWCTIM